MRARIEFSQGDSVLAHPSFPGKRTEQEDGEVLQGQEPDRERPEGSRYRFEEIEDAEAPGLQARQAAVQC